MEIIIAAVASFFVGLTLGKYIGKQEYIDNLTREKQQKKQNELWETFVKGDKDE
jgi:hypothetical protein